MLKTRVTALCSIRIMKIGLQIFVFILSLIAAFIFLASCVVAQSDGQGALVFIFSIPLMAALLTFAIFLSRKKETQKYAFFPIANVPKILACFIVLFFASAFVPGLRKAPELVMDLVGNMFSRVTGKTPYAFFKDRASFQNKLENALKLQTKINFSDLGVTFAWDTVCIFGPYTSKDKAEQILKFEWNIEERSEIHFSDSINALVFLYQGSVNQVVDLKRGIADFKNQDTCISREKAIFELEIDPNGLKSLHL